ncbi:MAG: hypothetical protein SFU21_12115 [Flavihumibacter sp.]|nr:hypothetical protein [Flavihumibacter sp.]
MKQILFLILIILSLTNCVKAQSLRKQTREFIMEIYKVQSSPAEPFIYTKGIDSYEKKEIIEALEKTDTLKKWRKVNGNLKVIDSLVLSTKEKKYIINKLERASDISLWDQFNFPHSFTISQDTVTAIFKDINRGWNYFRNTYGSSFNSFTIPIFFRDNKLCAFYYDNSCGGLCGEGVFAIYRQENKHWVRWFTIYEWVS